MKQSPLDMEGRIEGDNSKLPKSDGSDSESPSEPNPTGLEDPTDAPTIGKVQTAFASKLDGGNLLRQPALMADAGSLGPFWVAAASIAGLSHQHHARTGQDNYSFALAADEGAVVLAVADGLGSRVTTSQLGSALLARAVCGALAAYDTKEVLKSPRDIVASAVTDANDQVQRSRERAFPELTDRDLASTIAVCWIPFESKVLPLVAGVVGDCAVFTLAGGEYYSVFPRGGAALNVVDHHLPGPSPAEGLVVEIAPLAGVGAVVVTTDGLAEDIFGSPAVREWLAERWSCPVGPHRMLDALRYRRRGSQDDRTAVVLWPRPDTHVLQATTSPTGTEDHDPVPVTDPQAATASEKTKPPPARKKAKPKRKRTQPLHAPKRA